MILNACRSVESARSPPFFFFTTLATLTPPPFTFRPLPHGCAHGASATANGRATAGQPQHAKRKGHCGTVPQRARGVRGGGLPGTSSPTPAISLAPSKLGACWNPAHSRLGSSWHTDAFPPTAPPALGPSCHIPELRAASASWRHMAPPASIPEARRLPVQRHRTAPGPLLPRTCSAPTPPRTFVDAPLCTACASSHLSARTSVQFPVLGVEPTYCMGSAHSYESPRYQLRHGVPEHPLFCSAVQARCGRSI